MTPLFLHIFRTFYILYKIKKRGVRSYGIYIVTSITVRGRGEKRVSPVREADRDKGEKG